MIQMMSLPVVDKAIIDTSPLIFFSRGHHLVLLLAFADEKCQSYRLDQPLTSDPTFWRSSSRMGARKSWILCPSFLHLVIPTMKI